MFGSEHKTNIRVFWLSPGTFSECSVKVSIHRSSTVMFAEYSLNVRYIRCFDPNIKRTYEYLSLSGNVQRMFGEGFNSGELSPEKFHECSKNVFRWGLKTFWLSYTGGLPPCKYGPYLHATTNKICVHRSTVLIWVRMSTAEYAWVQLSTAEYAWVQLSTHEYSRL